jgi:MFS family permease
MSAVAEPVAHALAGDRLARRNALVLAIAQALAGGNNTVLVATAAIVGTMLAPDKGLATLPISIFVLGMWMGTLPMGVLARRLGRRNALQIGTACGVLTGLICCVAVLDGSFLLFNVGAVFSGFYASAHQSYRFAAADTATDEFRPKAISWVLLGGIFAGVVGAQLVIATQNLWPPYLFAATYIGQSALALIAGGVLMFVNIPKPPPRSSVGDGVSMR